MIKTARQKIIVIYHGNCPDGFGGAWAAWKKFGAKAAYIPAKDRLNLPYPLKNKEIYLIDYTYEPDIVKKLIKNNIRVTAIDHHVSQEASTKLTQKYSYAVDHSGATLAWNYFHPGKKMPMLLRYVEDRDIWKWRIPSSKEILMMVDLAPFDFKIWSHLAKDLEDQNTRATYVKKGALLLLHYRLLYEKLLSSVELVKFEGKKVYALNCPYYFADDLGHALALKTHSFAILWNQSKGKVRVSLRAENKKVDVSKIAKKYGGGGHKQSAGFSFEVGKKVPWKLIKTK